jgi:hypothetical protein
LWEKLIFSFERFFAGSLFLVPITGQGFKIIETPGPQMSLTNRNHDEAAGDECG